MRKYISPSRIAIPQDPNKIIQPLPRVLPGKPSFSKEIVIAVERKVGPYTDPNSIFKQSVDWLVKNNYKEIPSITTISNVDVIPELAVVYCHMGNDPLRIEATTKALRRLRGACPKPAASLMVELIQDNEEPVFQNKVGTLFDYYILRFGTERSKGIFQKEALWTIGGNAAFSLPSITKCLFLDADSCYQDNSWAYYISSALNSKPFIHAFSGIYYANQPDLHHEIYRENRLLVSYPYAIQYTKDHKTEGAAPGLGYACTKNFWENVLGKSWIINSIGSGDVSLWMFLIGLRYRTGYSTTHTQRLLDLQGAIGTNFGYANLLAMHQYHGPMSNRLYVVRKYLGNKFSTLPGSDVSVTDTGILEWKNTSAGNTLKEGTELMYRLGNEKHTAGSTLTTEYLKKELLPIIKKNYGVLSEPLIIVTYFYEGLGISVDAFKTFINTLKTKCKTTHIICCITNNKDAQAVVDKYIEPKLPLTQCASLWHVIYAFNHTDCEHANGMLQSDKTTLFIDPRCEVKHDFEVAPCPTHHLYMARGFLKKNKENMLTWDTSLILFSHIDGLFEHFINACTSDDAEDNICGRFVHPAEYINAYTFMRGWKVGDIKEYIDYKYRGQICSDYTAGVEDIMLP